MKPSVKLYIDKTLIEQVAETKYLGVRNITKDLIWDDHNKTVCNKVSEGLEKFVKVAI